MSGLYIHIPFCAKRCSYCDFYLITNLNLVSDFLNALKSEITLYSPILGREKFDTIFFGGGTPSLLDANQIQDILDHLKKNFDISGDCEITIEANPEDLFERDLSELRSSGINRLSLGVQSLIDSELKFLTRNHTSSEAGQVVNAATKYFDNVNVDIIYSLPGQTPDQIQLSLNKAYDLGAKHISAYTLTYEEKTLLFKSYEKGLVKRNSDEKEAEFYKFVANNLTAHGFEHYEVSNFAKPGYECRHNLKYWQYENYAGFGPSSHSMINGVRWNNLRDLGKYIAMLKKNVFPAENKYKLSSEQKKLEFIMLSLRSKGVEVSNYKKLFNEDFSEAFGNSIETLVNHKYAKKQNGYVKLTEEGYALADEIVAKYF